MGRPELHKRSAKVRTSEASPFEQDAPVPGSPIEQLLKKRRKKNGAATKEPAC